MGRNNLVALSAHGDHCSWRAVALVHQAYEALRKEIAQNHLNPKDNSNYDNESSLLNEISSNLKDAIVNETKNLYLKSIRISKSHYMTLMKLQVLLGVY